jgi:hypothetical protein
LCFGWIDGVMRSRDAETFLQRFTPRRKGSIWSKKNRNRAIELMDEGLMTEAGVRTVDDAKKLGGGTRHTHPRKSRSLGTFSKPLRETPSYIQSLYLPRILISSSGSIGSMKRRNLRPGSVEYEGYSNITRSLLEAIKSRANVRVLLIFITDS